VKPVRGGGGKHAPSLNPYNNSGGPSNNINKNSAAMGVNEFM